MAGGTTSVRDRAAHLTRIEATGNKRRYYRMDLQNDLFGGCALIREWGRIGSSGQVRRDLYDNTSAAIAAADALLRKKIRRGYAPPAS